MLYIAKPKLGVFGRFGIGKSAAAIYAFHKFLDEVAYVATSGNEFAPIYGEQWNPLRLAPTILQCSDPVLGFGQAMQEASKIGQEIAARGRYRGIIIDNLTDLMRSRVRQLRGGKTKLTVEEHTDIYTRLGDDVLEFLQRLVSFDAALIVIGHEAPPTSSRTRGDAPGSMALAGQLKERVPACLDLCVRVEASVDASGRTVRVFRRNELDALWRVKDRWDVVRDGQPFDLYAVCKAIYEKQMAFHAARGGPVVA